MIFESHAHFEDEKFDEDRDELLSSMRAHNIETVINIGTTPELSRRSLELAHRYPDVYAAVGVHPSDIDTLTDEEFEWLSSACADEKTVAVGEIGLDYYWEKDPDQQAKQREGFLRQLALADEVKLPVVIHSRNAEADTWDLMQEANRLNIPGVMHCYSYSAQTALKYVEMGYYLGIGGVVTFKNAKDLHETVEKVPLESLLVETDCPYLAPEPFRGMRNDSTYLPYVIKRIAQIKEITEDEVIEVTRRNGRELFTKVK